MGRESGYLNFVSRKTYFVSRKTYFVSRRMAKPSPGEEQKSLAARRNGKDLVDKGSKAGGGTACVRSYQEFGVIPVSSLKKAF